MIEFDKQISRKDTESVKWDAIAETYQMDDLYLFFGRGLTDKKKFYLRQSDLKELENFQSFRGDTIEHYDPD
ncbi:hypothetical protein, partial [Enterococcus faecium]|uniref:hypothetical protein n=1 Tax=Enterococcus faecium TaxID=1352 RepID=UPI00292D090A